MPLPVTFSAGLAGGGTGSERTQAALTAVADRNLYAAKRAGRDRVDCGDPQPAG
ncbi:MAG TPA: hypothetical protein VN408_23465 [Actinoplanes sp.]|nr:hypothetical protein [Actinoplanes sp.]